MSNIFQQVKEYIKANPHYLGVLFPNAKQKGNELYFDSPSYNSWSYNVSKGLAKDFRTNETQDIINIYQSLNGFVSLYDTVKDMAGKLNIESTTEDELSRIKRLSSSVVKDTIAVYNSEDKQKIINRIWYEALPLGGTIAEQYLRKRRITLPFSKETKGATLRYHSALYHNETKQLHPALIAAMYSDNKLVAVHRHYLDKDGNKLNVKQNKMSLGNVRGCAIKLGAQPLTSKLVICEGLESGLSLLQDLQMPELTVWCTISAHNIPNLKLPSKEQVTEIQIRPDIEPSGTGLKSAYAARAKWVELGYNVKVVLPSVKLGCGKVVDLNIGMVEE